MKSTRKKVLYSWVLFVVICATFFLLKPTFLKEIFIYLGEQNYIYIYVLIFILGVIRSFTLIPSTYLILLGLFFIPAWPLYFIILSGILISSCLVYYFFEYLQLDKSLNQKYEKQINKVKSYLKKYEFPVVVFWSFNPILPTDIICYIAGTMKLNIYKFLFALLLGEGIVCALYIFGGKYILNYFFSI
jgi:uncharacterized membrane protein YdjX (TVP38/TMEM64 family)